jgi:hypothetical protein
LERSFDHPVGDEGVLGDQWPVGVSSDRITIECAFSAIGSVIPKSFNDRTQGFSIGAEIGSATVIFKPDDDRFLAT